MQETLPGNDPPQVKVPEPEVKVTQAAPPATETPVEPSNDRPQAKVPEPEVKVTQAAPPAAKAPVEPSIELPPTVEVKVQDPEPPPTEVAQETSTEQWRQVVDRMSNFINSPPGYLTDFFEKYKQPLTSVGLILSVLIGVKLLSGLVGAVNEIPLVAPTFELIGLGYTAWFVYRYLLGSQNRQELSELIKSVREYVFGKGNSGN